MDSLVRADGAGSKFFSITLGNDTILLAADSTEDRMRWVAALKSEITGTSFEVSGTEGLSQSGKRLVTSLHEVIFKMFRQRWKMPLIGLLNEIGEMGGCQSRQITLLRVVTEQVGLLQDQGSCDQTWGYYSL